MKMVTSRADGEAVQDTRNKLDDESTCFDIQDRVDNEMEQENELSLDISKYKEY